MDAKAVIALASCAIVIGCMPRDDTDPPGGRSGMVIHIDHATGCQYLRVPGQPGITPRLDRGGNPMCGSKL